MKYTSKLSNGGVKPAWESLEITAELGFAKGLTIEGRTWGSSGCEIRLFDEKHQEMSYNRYDYHWYLFYERQMACDLAADMNLLFELMEIASSVHSGDLFPIAKEMRQKCEGRYGNPLPDSEYEVRVVFV